jgi:hypothetical protein
LPTDRSHDGQKKEKILTDFLSKKGNNSNQIFDIGNYLLLPMLWDHDGKVQTLKKISKSALVQKRYQGSKTM